MSIPDSSTADESPPQHMPADEAFDLLGTGRRRIALWVLSELPAPVDRHRLATEVARIEGGYEYRANVSESEWNSVYVSLYQQHLEILDSADVIRWDRVHGNISLTDRADGLLNLIAQFPMEVSVHE